MYNKGDVGNAKVNLQLFITSMAEGPGNVKSRLIESEEYLLRISDEDFPEDLRQDWQSIWHDLTKKTPTRSLSSIGHTTLAMRFVTVSKMVKRITKLNSMLKDYKP